MKKPRKFGDGGETIDYIKTPSQKEAKERALDDTLPADSGLAQALNQPGDNPEGMYRHIRQMTAAKPAKPKVTLAQLQAFKKQYGADKDLTDYMNKQQGLTRRGGSTPPAPSKASAAPKAAAPEPKTGPMSDEERVSSVKQIPTGGDRAAPTPGDGRSVTGSDLSRNVSNTLNALAVSKGVPMAQIAAEAAMGTRAGKALSGLMGGKKAAEVHKFEPTMSNVSAAKRAKLAGELRRGEQPTKFTSPKKNPKNTRKFDDETGVEFRKGGATKGYAKGGSIDGIAQRGKTRGKMC